MKRLLILFLFFLGMLSGVSAEVSTTLNTTGSESFTQALDSGSAYSVTNTGTILNEGYFSLVKVYIAGTYDNGTIQIKKGSEIIASKYFDAAGPGLYPVTFSISDYSQLLSAGDTYTITFIQGSPTESVYYYTSAYSGSYFSFSSQTTFGRGAQITYTAVDVLEVDYDKYINITSSQFNISTSYNTNIFYSLDNNSSINLCYNCVSYQLNLTGLSENWHDLDIITLNGSSELNARFNFSVDLTPPSINNSIPTEINSYQFLGTYFSCSDINLDYCNISINGQNKATGVSFTLNQSGNLSYTITAQDLAGNTATVNGVLFVNPYQYIYFETETATPITNFYINDVLFSNYYYFKLYDYALGSRQITFEKFGYIPQTINITTNNTSEINTTYTSSSARIVVYVRDKDTQTLITGVNITADFVATVGLKTTTTTGIINVTNLLFNNEEYYLLVSASGYQSEGAYFTFTNQELSVIDVYLIETNNTNLGIVYIKPVDRFGQPITGAIVRAMQWDSDSSQFIGVSQDKTGSEGLGTLNILLNTKIYKFTASYENSYAETGTEVVDDTENGKTITIVLAELQQEYDYILEHLRVSSTESYNNVTNISTISMTWEDLNGVSVDVCMSAYRTIKNTKSLLQRQCTSGISGTYILQFDINNSYTTDIYPEIKLGTDYHQINKYTYLPSNHPSKLLESLGLGVFVVPLLVLLGIGIGMYLENIFVGTFVMAVLMGVSLTFAPGVLTKGVVMFMFFIGWLTINYGGKQR